MRQFFFFFLYLYIYTNFLGQVAAQNITLKIEAEKEVTSSFLDSLDITLKFEDYLSLKSEADSLSQKFQKIFKNISHVTQL